MANLFVNEPIYTTIIDLRETTTNPDLKESSIVNDENVKILITKSQDIIDAVIECYWTPNISWQKTIFPIKNEDWTDNTEIPLDIQLTTILLVENLYVWGVLDGWAYWVWGNWKIKSETSRWHTVSYFGGGSSAIDNNEFLNQEILTYLDPYILNLSAQWYK